MSETETKKVLVEWKGDEDCYFRVGSGMAATFRPGQTTEIPEEHWKSIKSIFGKNVALAKEKDADKD